MREMDENESHQGNYLSFGKALLTAQMSRSGEGPVSHESGWVGAACFNTTAPQECVLHKK